MKIYPKMPCSTVSSWKQSKVNRQLCRFLKKINKCKVNRDDLFVYLFMLITIVVIVFIIILVWRLGGDRCNGQKIKQALCKEYNNGVITGDLCYSICIEKSIPLHYCVSETHSDITYRHEESLIKIQKYPAVEPLPYPISLETFQDKVFQFLQYNLGEIDSPQLFDRVLGFTDFNANGEMNYAESNTLWQLLHTRQFFILLIFQDEASFPKINGTCGSAYAYDYIPSSPLYQKKSDVNPVMQYFFPNYNQWMLPSWEKRAQIAIGLLELSSILTESFSTKFYMCDIKHTNFGVSTDFEAKVVNLESVMSEQQLLHSGGKKRCYFDSECSYGIGCSMSCDVNSRTCSNVPRRPAVSFICDILRDYVLFDSPEDCKFLFESLISQCQSLTSLNHTISHNVIPNKIKDILWNQVKNKPVDWLKPRKKRSVVQKNVPLKKVKKKLRV
ncbi:divergent protein kinase domain 1B-like [Mytilus galloprovincialis]|uniref:divergent protein kinase domain 1B-like n=1 Tax=Mytilus galloprovincialis TaxID=29158 RepID=UPI003F7CC03D